MADRDRLLSQLSPLRVFMRCECGAPLTNARVHKIWHQAKGGTSSFDYALYSRLVKAC